MQTQRLPDDARRILGAYNRAVLEASQRTVLRTYAMSSEKPAPRTLKEALTKPGDPMAMRGVPIQAKGVGGTSPGTAPHAVR